MGKRVLVTGGAGFVGGNLSVALGARHPDWEVVAFDNLWRRGSDLNLPRLADAGARFVRGDVRAPEDLEAVGEVDALVECSADPSALAGVDGSGDYAFHTNLVGAYNCLELCRRRDAQMVFLSTSRIYPYGALDALRHREGETRFELEDGQDVPGASSAGIAERFPLAGARTLYGATKLSAELLIEEFASNFGLRAVIDRCGVIAGPWQMGKVDQGVFTYWLASFLFGRPLRYIGYGGQGKQVRDLLHVDDLVDLVDEQLGDPEAWAGATCNVGGGAGCSLSLAETTAICRELTGRDVPVEPSGESRPGDVRIYLSDCRRLFERTEWRPRRGARRILEDTFEWLRGNEAALKGALG